MTLLAHNIRPAIATDRRLIGSTWSKTFLGCSDANPRGVGPLSNMSRPRYFSQQEELIERLLGHPSSKVLVACAPEHPDHVFGWVCAAPEGRILHFLYVSWAERRFGVASSLIRSVFDRVGVDPIAVSHWTRVLPCYFEKWRLEYDPFTLFGLV